MAKDGKPVRADARSKELQERRRKRRLRAAAGPKGGLAAAAPAGPARRGGASGPGRADARIERAIAFINERARAIRGELTAIGEYLLREFFDGDPRVVRSKDPRKLGSFRDLASREDCVLSYSTLWRAVNLAIQERQLGAVAAPQQLSTSHKIELLAVDDLREKRRLAKAAAKEGWSTRELRRTVRRRASAAPGEKRPTRGGGEIALVQGSLRHLARAAETGALSPERIDDLPPARLEPLVVLLEEVAAKLARSAKVGRRTLAESAPPRPA